MKNVRLKCVSLFILGMAVSIVPPIIAVLSYFPVWRRASDGSIVCGFTLLLLLLAAKPLYNCFKKLFASPSAYMMWLVIFGIFFALSRIADEVTVISFVGFLSNVTGAVLFKLSGLVKKEEVEENEEKSR